MTLIVEGLYEHGTIRLVHPPAGLPEGKVRLIVISAGPESPTPCQLRYGKYPGDTSTLDDFKDAQWSDDAHGSDTPSWDEPHGS